MTDSVVQQMQDFLETTPLDELAILAAPPNLPLTCFPKVIEVLLDTLFAKEWSQTSEAGKKYLQWISVKAESIDALIHPHGEKSIKGFELLAIDIEGRSFAAINEEANRHSLHPILLRFATLIVTLMTMRALRQYTNLSDEDMAALMFTQNVDNSYLNYPLALKRLLQVFPEYHEFFYFEVNEHITEDYLSTIRSLSQDLEIRLALDDTNKMNAAIHWSLLDLADWIKIDFHATAALEQGLAAGNGDKIIRYFEKYASDSGSLVIVLEGLREESPLKTFLQENWKHDTELYYQSRERTPLPPWDQHFGLIQDHLPNEFGLFFKGLIR